MRTRTTRLLHVLGGVGSLPVFGVLILGVLVLGVANRGTASRWIPPATPERPLPNVEVRDESDDRVSLGEVLDSSRHGAVLIAPAYARCRSSCPELVRALERGLRGLDGSERPSVVFFLFDARETPEDVQAFRASHGVPAAWSLLRAADANATRVFFDAYSIAAMSSSEGFAHPSQILVLDEHLRWSGSLPSSSLGTSAIRDALAKTRLPRWRATLARPGTWVAIASIGLLGAFATIAVALLASWRKTPSRSFAPSPSSAPAPAPSKGTPS